MFFSPSPFSAACFLLFYFRCLCSLRVIVLNQLAKHCDLSARFLETVLLVGSAHLFVHVCIII